MRKSGELMAQPWSSSKVLLKVGITGVLGGGSYALTNLFESSEVAKITLSVLVAGSALIVQFMMDFESGTRRLEQKFDDHAQAVEERVKEGFARFGEITGFLGRLDTDTGRAEEVERLVRNVAALDPARARIFQAFADAEISRVAGLLGDLGGRYVDYEGRTANGCSPWRAARTAPSTPRARTRTSLSGTPIWGAAIWRPSARRSTGAR